MISAAHAREQTLERITQVAKEFIANEIDAAVQEAINKGKFFCQANLKHENPNVVGAEVVRQLQVLGFKADHINCQLDPYGYIELEWEEV